MGTKIYDWKQNLHDNWYGIITFSHWIFSVIIITDLWIRFFFLFLVFYVRGKIYWFNSNSFKLVLLCIHEVLFIAFELKIWFLMMFDISIFLCILSGDLMNDSDSALHWGNTLILWGYYLAGICNRSLFKFCGKMIDCWKLLKLGNDLKNVHK